MTTSVREPGTQRGLCSRPVEVTLPIEDVLALWSRAYTADAPTIGHFDARSTAIVVWSDTCRPPEKPAEPIGSFLISWSSPTIGAATICRLQWDPAAGGSEAALWRALDRLHPAGAAARIVPALETGVSCS